MRVVCCQTAAVVLIAASAVAQPPEIEGFSPRGVQRGAAVELALEGDRLDSAKSLLFDRPGVRLVEFRSQGEGQAVAALEDGNEATLGEHLFWVVGSGGASHPQVLRVGPYPVVEEKEPNNDLASAQRVEPSGETVAGVIEGADVDVYRVELEPGQRVSAQVVAMRLGGVFLDAHLEVVGPDGRVLQAMDDSPVLGHDPHLSVVAEQAGTHYFRVRDAAFDGEYLASYLLHVGPSCQPVVAYPCGGAPGESLSARLIGDATGEIHATVPLPAQSDGYTAYRHDDRNGAPSLLPVRLRVVGLPNVLEDPAGVSEAGQPPVALNGVLSQSGEIDQFGVNLTAGDRIRLELFGARLGSPIDSVLQVMGPDGRVIASNDDAAVHDSVVSLTAAESGRHVVSVRDHLDRGGETFVYRVEIDTPRPSLVLAAAGPHASLPEQAQGITLAPGGRTAMLLSATRGGFHGPVTVEPSGLPVGVTATIEPLAADSHLCQVVFEASSDAKPGAALVGFHGIGHTGAIPVEGGLRQRVGLVRGQPRRAAYYGVDTDRMPLVVTESQPVSIAVVQPNAALSQDGLMELDVRVDRQHGFAGSVTLTALRLPGWVETSEDEVRIGAKDSAGRFPLIALDRAAPGDYPLVLIATARVDGAEVWTSSQRFTVRVEEPYAVIQLEPGSASQGAEAEVHCTIDWQRLPEGEVRARLLGLPKHAAAPEVTLRSGATSLTFPLKVGDQTPAAVHNTLFVELSIPEAGERRREYHARGGVFEVLRRGAQPQDLRSRLEILRQSAGSTVDTTNLSVQTSTD
ncbi:hypothetical protein KOR34_13550 [Posidoniimonas corsicana]|uniref:Peptidase C-terminal archaeal/bacterial domain-containing protein n=2 Tax=Posidoniimonas corsicana TaxID=1938618 RepID=A0A5C5VEX2_9BACT|nr:hypothetical protein KOR34_13550 [Posidoniimonas corsicana]